MPKRYQLPQNYSIDAIADRFVSRVENRTVLPPEVIRGLFLTAVFPNLFADPHALSKATFIAPKDVGTILQETRGWWHKQMATAKRRAELTLVLWILTRHHAAQEFIDTHGEHRDSPDAAAVTVWSGKGGPAARLYRELENIDFQGFCEVAEEMGIPAFDDRAMRNALDDMRRSECEDTT